MKIDLRLGDCIEVLKTLPDNSVDSVITDPPYGLSFMNKHWDYDVPSVDIWKECLRVLKPGGHLLSFAGSRTYHRMAVRIEDAGFEIRDQIMWVYGSGFPKSHNIGKAIDKKQGIISHSILELKQIIIDYFNQSGLKKNEFDKLCGFKAANYMRTESREDDGWGEAIPSNEKWIKIKEVLNIDTDEYDELFQSAVRDVVGRGSSGIGKAFTKEGWHSETMEFDITEAKNDAAKEWEGWGTALKPAHEPIVLARKPLSEKSIAENVLKHGTGGINIDGSRIEMKDGDKMDIRRYNEYHDTFNSYEDGESAAGKEYVVNEPHEGGRFPANIIFDEESGKLLDEQSGYGKGQKNPKVQKGSKRYGENQFTSGGMLVKDGWVSSTYNDEGGASRYFFRPNGSHFDFFNYIYLLCGNILEKQQGVGILNGVILEVEKCLVNHEQFTIGNKSTEQFQKDMKSTISILIEQMTELKTYNYLQKINIDYYTQNFVKTIEKLMELNIDDVKTAGNINYLKHLILELVEHIKVIVKNVPNQNYKNGEKEIENITTNITNNIENPTRFIYQAKASKKDRTNDGAVVNSHATVKPTDLMRYLINLVTPKGGTTLDPFMGSGSTGKAAVRCGVNFIGIEKEEEYFNIARARIEHEKNKPVQQKLL